MDIAPLRCSRGSLSPLVRSDSRTRPCYYGPTTPFHTDKHAIPIDTMLSPLSPLRPPGEVWQMDTCIILKKDTPLYLPLYPCWRHSLRVAASTTCGRLTTSVTPSAFRGTRDNSRGKRWKVRWGVWSAHVSMSGQHGFDLVSVTPLCGPAGGRGISLISDVDLGVHRVWV